MASPTSAFPSTSQQQPIPTISDCKQFTETLPFCTAADQQMLLHFAEREYVLFSFWKTGSAMGMFGSCLLVILLCILSEAIELCRNFLAKEHTFIPDSSSDTSSISDNIQISDRSGYWKMIKRCFTSYRVTQAALYGLHVMFGHVLILIIVSFNVWLLVSVAIGKSIGYFLFKASPVVEKTTNALAEAATPSPRPGRRTLEVPFTSTSSSNNLFVSKGYHSHSNSSDT